MAAQFTVNASFTGFREANRQIDKIIAQVERRGNRRALNKASRPIIKGARRKVRRRHGDLRKSLGNVIRMEKKTGAIISIIGPRRGRKRVVDGKPVDPANYAHLVEYGTQPHEIKPRNPAGALPVGNDQFAGTVQHPGTPAAPFLRPAYDENKNEAPKDYGEVIGGFIESEAKKANARIVSGKVRV